MSRAAALCLGLALALSAAAARAEGIYLTPPQLCAKLFPEAPHQAVSQLTLTDAELAQADQLFGYRLEKRTYSVITVSDAGGTKGHVFVLDVMGQNAPITFGVGVTADGVIRGVEVVAYREPRGEEIRAPRFLRQLQGKQLKDPLKLGVDVDAISGATISSRSTTLAARKALALAAVLHQRALAAQAPRAPLAVHPAPAP